MQRWWNGVERGHSLGLADQAFGPCVALADQPTMRSVELPLKAVGVMASYSSGQSKQPTEAQVLPWKVTHTVVTLNEPDAYGVNHMLKQLDDLADAGLPEQLAEQAHRS